ncbi:MAG: zinc-dependent alcohol dehydrogenase family protein [Candidatus Rokubacteria bacterium]|nr:zinc-dependent alcohol dehydrogenase family protein [Candidatus Rokubacteria bacterium]MBI3826428.1 zinc-dependent alcohol dehydrogenase family protein [Candidatus Rokubacteria bacterium]
MRAMVLHGPGPIEGGPLRVEDVDPPVPGVGEIRVRVSACGICRTDLHVVEGELPARRAPLIPGHQVVGRVDALGSGASRFALGERVGIAWVRWTCGACGFCRTGRENLCERAEFTGWTADGGYAEQAVVPEAFAYAIPAAFGDAGAAPLLCAGIIGYRALRLAAVPSGGGLALYGFGSSAHITLQVARARGVEVYVCTREPRHRALARALGATWVGAAAEPLPVAVEGAIIFAPAGELVPAALRSLAPGGTLALAGIHMSDVPSLAYADLYRERVIRSVANNTRDDGEGLLREAARIPLTPEVTTFPLADANRALGELKRGGFAGAGVLLTDAARGV